MQKQALKGLFFNISTCFSPLLAVFLTGENSLMFSAYLPIRTILSAVRTKLRPAPPPLAYKIRCTLSAQSPLPCSQPLPFCSSTNVPFLSNPCKIGKNCITL